MRKILLLLAAIGLCSAVAVAQNPGFQTGKIVEVKKLASKKHAQSHTQGTDAPLTVATDSYKVSIQVGDTVYICNYHTTAGSTLDWAKGKEVQVQIKSKSVVVKRVSGEETLQIVSTAKATTP